MAENTGTKELERDGESGWEDPGIPSDEPQVTRDEAFSASTSEFAASPQVHQEQGRKGTKGGGQNKRVDPVIGIPDPKFRLFKSDATNPHQRVKSFLNYWNALPQWCKDNTLLYVYRDHPVLKYIERDPENKEQEFNYIDKISGSEPLQDEMDVLNRYGCGNYKLVFNAIENKKPNRTLCTVYVVNLGSNDFKSNPPTDRRISDTKNVDLEHPSNKAYVSFLRGSGLLPSQIDAIRGEQEVATAELIKETQTTTNKLVDALIDQNKDKVSKSKEDTGMVERSMAAAMDTVKKGAEAAIDITRQANDYAANVRKEADSQRVAAPTAPMADPMELAIRLVTLIQAGKGESSTEVTALRAEIATLQANQMKMMQEQLNVLTKQLTTNTSPAATNPFSSMQEGMKAIREMKEVVDEIGGGGKEASVAEDVADAAGAPKWLVRFAPLMQQGMTLLDGFFRMRAAQNGQPMPMPQYPPQGFPPPQGYPQNPQGYPPPGYQPAPMQWNGPTPQPAPQQVPGPQLVQGPPQRHPLGTLDPTQFTPELANLLLAIATPLHVHLAEGDTGTTFAEWFLGGFPNDTFEQIQAFGPDMVVGALYSFPPTLAAIQQFPAEQVQAFVAEFLNPQFEEADKEDTVTKDNQPA